MGGIPSAELRTGPSAELRTGPSTELRTRNGWGCLMTSQPYARACKRRDRPPLWRGWRGFFLFSDYIAGVIGWPEMSHVKG